MYTLALGCSSIILRAKVQLRIKASARLEHENPGALDERDGATTSDENIGFDESLGIGGTGPTANGFENLGSGVSNWHAEFINGSWVSGGGR